jgi:CYTH domain-containing protein
MNERIRELAEQAQIWIADYNGQRWEIDPKKFAELIVKECAKIADIADESKCEWIGGNILIHFGVKE